MAATIKNASIEAVGPIVQVCSVRGRFQVINTDLKTADTANLLKPWNITRSDVYWLKVPEGATRGLFRARDLATAVVTTSPVVRLWGAYPALPGRDADVAIRDSGMSGTITATNFAEFMRLDAADQNAAGFLLTFNATTNSIDATYGYTNVFDLTGYDLKGASYIAMIVETAASVVGAAMGQVLFLN